METGKLTGMLVVLLCVWVLTLSGCGGSSGDGASAPAALTTFSEDVALCTPQVESEGLPGAEDAGPMTIADWSGWNPSAQSTVLYNLLTQDCVEGMFDPITKADMFITILNSLRDYWQTDGVHEGVTLGDESMTLTMTVTVDTSVKSVTVPFFTDDGGQPVEQAVDRLVTIEGTMTGGDSINAQIAFSTSADGEAIVVRTYFVDKGETSMFYGIKNDVTGELDASAACFVDEGADGNFEVALKWHGNTQEGTFALTQYKNSCGNTHILAGGEAAGDMAFLAQIGTDTGAGGDPWYIVCNTANLNGTQVDEFLNAAISLDGDDRPVLDYIKEGNSSCLGYLNSYPESADDIPSLN
jgi:hypothetical protein